MISAPPRKGPHSSVPAFVEAALSQSGYQSGSGGAYRRPIAQSVAKWIAKVMPHVLKLQ